MNMVTIEIAGVNASIEDGVWSCSNPTLQRILTRAMEFPGVRPHGGHPSPDLAIAEATIAHLGGGQLLDRGDTDPDDGADNVVF